jgi:hypothetical protein
MGETKCWDLLYIMVILVIKNKTVNLELDCVFVLIHLNVS